MRWVYYGVAVAASLVAALLWYVVLVIYPSVSGASFASRPAPPDVLPVAPVLHPLVPSAVRSPAPRLLCVAGYYAKQTGDAVETLLIDNKPVPCSR